MSTFNNPPVTEGDALTAASINAKAGTDLETPVNDLEEASVERYALDAQHLPDAGFASVFTSGYQAFATNTTHTSEKMVYDNGLPLTSANTAYPYTYQTFDGVVDAPGGGAIAYYGATDSAPTPPNYTATPQHIFEGWRIPSLNQGLTNKAEVSLAAATNFDTEGIKGVLCRGAVEPIYAGDPKSGTGTPPSFIYPSQASVAVAIGWEDSLGNRHIVERSVRFYSVNACKYGNAGTSTFLKQSDLDGRGNGTCNEIFLAVACVRPGDINSAKTGSPYRTTSAQTYYDHLMIRYYDLSVAPIRAGTLS